MSKQYDLNFDDIKNQYTGDINLLYHLLPGGVLRGCEFRAGSINGEPGDSFGYNINTGIFSDFASNEKGGSIIDLVMAVKHLSSPKEAAEYIVNFSGSAPTAPVRQRKKSVEELFPAPRGIPAPTKVYAEGKNHDISRTWAYRDKFGDVLMYDVRVDLPKGGKLVLPMRWQNGMWVPGTATKNRPLYRLDAIAEASKIIIVEGCKTADALQQYMGKTLVITWQGGSNAVAKSDWTPLRGRSNIIIIPDADEPGRKAAMQIANILVEQDCKVKMCDTSSMESVKQGWDFADALADGWDSDRVFDFILANTRPFGEDEPSDISADNTPEMFETESVEIVVKDAPRRAIEYKDDFFKCLGYNEGLYFYYVKATGLLHTLSPRDHTKSNLIALAPLSFWEANFTTGKQVDWAAAADYFIRVQEKIGMYDYTKVRGRGAWLDEGRIVLHIGDKLIVDDTPTEIHAFPTKYHYERRPPIYMPLQTILPDKYSAQFIELCQMARWRNAAYGEILAGWVFSAMIGGIFPMRSHVYIDGEKKSGKSWLINNVIAPALGDNKLAVEGATTEAGIRAALRADTIPVIFDESEAEQKTDAMRLQGIFNLARAAATSDGGAVLKGATNGQAGGVRYTCRSAFLFASINVSMAQAADLSRTVMLSLRGKPNRNETDEVKKADYENFLKMSDFAGKLLTPDYCRCLFTRAIKLAPTMLKSAKMISDCASKQLGDRRIGDQLGMIGAGVWHLRHQEMIDEDHAKSLISSLQISEDKQWEEDDNAMALQWLLGQEISMTINGTKSIVRLLSLINEVAKPQESTWGHKELLRDQLKQQGIDVKDGLLYLSVASAHYPSRMFALSEWGKNGWKSAMLRLPFSAKTTGNYYFCQWVRALAISIPLKTIGDMEGRNEI